MHTDSTGDHCLGWVQPLPALAQPWRGAGCEGSPAAPTLITFTPQLPSRRWGWLGSLEPPQPPAAMAERDI